MIPNLNLFGRTFSAYTLFSLVGVLCVVFFVYFFSKRNGLDELISMNMILVCFVGVFLGGHILYGLTNLPLLLRLIADLGQITSFKSFVDWVVNIFGGSVFYGGLTGAIICAFLFTRKFKTLRCAYIDVAVLAIPLFHFFGRLGCFFSGCCYGIECSFGVTYHYSQAPGVNGVTRFPVQLVEALINVLIFLLLIQMYQKGKFKGRLLFVYLIVYPTARFCLEFLRGDDLRGHIGFLSTSQMISIIYFGSAVIALAVDYTRCRKNNRVASTTGETNTPEQKSEV